MSKPRYRIYIAVTTGPHKTPVQTYEYEGRKRAFIDAAALLAALWRSIRLLERGKLRRIEPFGMSYNQWQQIHGKKIRVVCDYCEHTVSAGNKGKAALDEHMASEHPMVHQVRLATATWETP